MANYQAKKSVLIFSTAYLPMMGGAEIAVKEITDRIKGFQFDLITARIKPSLLKYEKVGRVNVYRVGFGWGAFDKLALPLAGFLKARKLNQKRNYPIIWSIMASQASVAASFVKMFFPSKKVVLTLQEGDPEKHLERYVLGIGFLYCLLVRPWHKMIFKKADQITAISKSLKKRASINKAKAPIAIVPNGVDLEKFYFGCFDKNLSDRLGIGEGEKVIITVSRLVKKNGLVDLIKAGKFLAPSFKMLVIGEGEDEAKLRKIASDLSLENKVLFLGRVEHDELCPYLALADVFVRPSLSEGLGNVFLEAMAVGTPIIGTPVGGIPDFLEDGKTGLFCQKGSSRDIGRKINRILEDEQLRKKLSQQGLELVEKKYHWEKISSKMGKIFNSLL